METDMIGKLLATTALLLVITGSAQAQSATGAMLASGYQMATTDALASKLALWAQHLRGVLGCHGRQAPRDRVLPSASEQCEGRHQLDY